jgi:imidazolonepropionase
MSEHSKAADLAVVDCGELLTLAGPSRPRVGAELRELGIVRGGTLLVRDGKILAAGPHADLKSQIGSATEIIDAQNSVATPGFVDAHTHPVFAGTRAGDFEQRIAGKTYQEIAAAGGGISSTVAATRAATEDELIAATLRHAKWFLRGGTTTIEAKSGYGLSLDAELKSLRTIRAASAQTPLQMVPTVLAAHTVPVEHKSSRNNYIHLVIEQILPQVAEQRLAEYCDVFCDEHAFTLEESRHVLTAAKHLGLGLRMHVEQFASDGGALLAADLGAATADHLECSTADSFRALAAAKVQPVLVPASVFALGRTDYPDARRMIELGLAPVVATDFNPGSSPTPSMQLVLSLSCIYMRMSPAEAISAATINAAFSLGRGSSIGSLEPGKRADFVIHEFNDYRELAYFIAVPARPRVFIAGKPVE